MKMRIILLLLIFVEAMAYGQKKETFVKVEGQVFSSLDKTPLQGVMVSAKGIKKIGITNKKGYFKISIPEDASLLTFKTVDFHSKVVRRSKDSVMNVYLLPLTTHNYDEFFSLPFQDKRTEDHVGSSVALHTRDFDRGRVFVDEMLAGSVAGVRTLQKSGMPGEGNFVSIRGTRSLVGSNAPILVVDGMPMISNTELSSVFTGFSKNIFRNISSKEVDNISILKGVDAAPFGSIGSNGVVYVNTDRALDMETKVEFESVNGISVLAKEMPVLNGDEFRGYLMQVGQTTYDQNQLASEFPFLNSTPSQGAKYYTYAHNTNWQKEVFAPAFSTENTLTVKGGDAQAKFSMLAGYMKIGGIEKNTYNDRYFARINGDMQMSQKLSMFANIGFSYFDNRLHEQGLVPEINPMLASLLKPSILAPKQVNKSGEEINYWEPVREFGISNPSVLTEEVEGSSAMYNTMISLGLNYSFTSSLKLRGMIGVNYDYSHEKIFIPGITLESIVHLEGGKAQNMIREGIERSMAYYGNLALSFDHNFKKGHHLSASLGTQLFLREHMYEYAKGINTATDYNKLLTDVKDASGKHLSGYDEPWRWGNFFGNAVYSYNKQLYLGASITADASSMSGENSDIFNFYPSVNIAWNMANASFLKSQNWLDYLAVRAEFSQKGNSMFSSKLSKYHYVTNEFLGLGGVVRSGIPNGDLKPEYVESLNLGLDFRTLGNNLTLKLDIYRDATKDMILPDNLESAYGSNYRYINSGEMRSEGIEIGIDANVLNIGDFSWHLGATIAHEKTEIISLGAGVKERLITLTDGAEIITKLGESPYQFYGLESSGVYESSTAAASDGFVNVQGSAFRGGDMRFVDAHKDNIIDNKDKVAIGDPTPDFYGGVFTSFQYKTFSLSAQFTYSYGNDVYNATRRMGESMKDFSGQFKSVKNAWFYEGHQTDMPRADYGDPMGNSQFSSRWIEDGSYLKLKNLTLSYEHPKKLWVFTKFQAYVVGENLFTSTKYLGYDPEFAYSYDHSNLGVDYGKVPGARTFKLGLRLGF